MNKGVTFVGSLVVDHIKQIETYPSESTLTKILSETKATGGLAANTSVALKKLDPSLDVEVLGAVGDDSDGKLLINFLEENNINSNNIILRGTTSFTDVLSSPKTRTFFTYSGSSGTLDIDDIDINKINTEMVHLGYILLLEKLDEVDDEYGTKMARLLKDLQDKGHKTSVDIVSEDSNRFSELVPPALKYTDNLIINEFEASKTVGIEFNDNNVEAILNKLKDMGVSNWVIIHSPTASWGLDENRKLHYLKSNNLPDSYIKGTVGAGDAYCAGCLLAISKGLNMDKALKYGTASAQISLKSPSASGSMDTIENALVEYEELSNH